MNKEFPVKEQPQQELVFYQTKGGMYDSTPEVNDVLVELGLKKEEGDDDWRQAAGNRAHGEYTENVDAAVEYCKAHNIDTKEGVEQAIKNAKQEDA